MTIELIMQSEWRLQFSRSGTSTCWRWAQSQLRIQSFQDRELEFVEMISKSRIPVLMQTVEDALLREALHLETSQAAVLVLVVPMAVMVDMEALSQPSLR